MSETILVVDDERDLELIICQKFRKKIHNQQYAFFFAYNGIEALEQLKAHPEISIILTDINMPEMDGLTLLSHINSRHNPLLKTIIISAYDDMNNIRNAMNNGAIDFLTKPIDLNDLEITLENTIQRLNEIRTLIIDRQQLLTIKQDLKIAQNIQNSFLPKKSSLQSDICQFSVFGTTRPALEVGGDFYDFFYIDDHRLGFVIGDVAGKGIGAAMFMGVSRILIRAAGQTAKSSVECISYVNNIICETSENIFVAVFYGILDCQTGQIDYTNAGHTAPFILKNNGIVENVSTNHNTVVGVMANYAYKSSSLQLHNGDTFFICTDGMTEAFNSENNVYGTEHIQKQLSQLSGQNPENIVNHLLQDVLNYVQNTKQVDDITLLAVKFETKQ
ncbi:MAG: SpoIIE family protein phosphatase [Bacteroidales bacterium]|nr:SpoIIE family protein phosphatase [Bacteroidales bacterium]